MNGSAALLTALEKAWSGDVEALLAVYTPQCVFVDKAFNLIHHGHAGLRELFAFTYSMMPDFRASYGDHVITADRAAAQWTFTGTFQGNFEDRHYEKVPVRIEGVSFMRLDGGKIAYNTDYWNLAALTNQLKLASSKILTAGNEQRAGL